MNFSCKSGEHRLFLRAKNKRRWQNAFWAERGLAAAEQAHGSSNGQALLHCTACSDVLPCSLQTPLATNMLIRKFLVTWLEAGEYCWFIDLSASIIRDDKSYIQRYDMRSFFALLQAALLMFAWGSARGEKGVWRVQVNSRGNSCDSVGMPVLSISLN